MGTTLSILAMVLQVQVQVQVQECVCVHVRLYVCVHVRVCVMPLTYPSCSHAHSFSTQILLSLKPPVPCQMLCLVSVFKACCYVWCFRTTAIPTNTGVGVVSESGIFGII